MHAGFVDVDSCWVCGGGGLTREHDARLDLDIYRDQHPDLAQYTGETVWFRTCSACGFTQPERVPLLPGFFDRLYDQLWSPDWVREEFESSYKDLIFRTILAGLNRRTRCRTRLLDIGAHAGRFMHLAQAAGWQPEGIELNARTAAFAADRTGLPVYSVNVEKLEFATARYGAITLIDVLEHLPYPGTLLARIHEALSPNGWIAVKVPSGPAQRTKERLRARLHHRYHPRLADNLVHVNHFSPLSLCTALEGAGFRDVTIEIAPPELPPARRFPEKLANLGRRLIYFGGRLVPGALNTPVALNLLAFGRRP